MFRKTVTILFVLFLAVGVFFTTAAGADAVTDGEVSGVVQCTYGTAIAGADVALIDIDAQEIVATTKADADGSFCFADVAADGNYAVATAATGFEAASAVLEEDGVTLELAPMNAPTALLMAFVVGPNTSDPDVVAGMTATFNGEPMTWTGFWFELHVEPLATGTIIVQAPGFRPANMQVTAADYWGSFAMVDIFMMPGFVVQARVECAWNPGRGIDGATVTLMPAPGLPLGREPIVGGPTVNGVYIFGHVGEGTWRVVAEHDDFMTTAANPPFPDVPSVGSGTIDAPIIRMAPIITAEARCARTNALIPYADITLWRARPNGTIYDFPNYAAHRDAVASGMYRFAGLPAGRYTVTATADEFFPGAAVGYLDTGGTLTVYLQGTVPPLPDPVVVFHLNDGTGNVIEICAMAFLDQPIPAYLIPADPAWDMSNRDRSCDSFWTSFWHNDFQPGSYGSWMFVGWYDTADPTLALAIQNRGGDTPAFDFSQPITWDMLDANGYLHVYAGWRQFIFGDVNEDGLVNTADVSRLASFVAGNPVHINRLAADADMDGDINEFDVSLIASFAVGNAVILGPQPSGQAVPVLIPPDKLDELLASFLASWAAEDAAGFWLHS